MFSDKSFKWVVLILVLFVLFAPLHCKYGGSEAESLYDAIMRVI